MSKVADVIEEDEVEEGKRKVNKPDYKFLLSENYAITTDPRNIILLERYEKRDGKGKHAPLSGEFGWKHLGYFHSFDRIADVLVDMEIGKVENVKELNNFANKVLELKKEMREFLKEKVELRLD